LIYGGGTRTFSLLDLYGVDVKTGVAIAVETTGAVPKGRMFRLVTSHGNSLYVWGGQQDNGNYPKELSVLNLDTLVRSAFAQDARGRARSQGVLYGDGCCRSGGCKNVGLAVMNFECKTVECLDTGGPEVPRPVVGAEMVLVENYLFVFGGRTRSEWMSMYVCDLERMSWFVFPLTPDSTTTSFEDGQVDKVGQFLIAIVYAFCMCYLPERREIIWFMGRPLRDAPPLQAIAIGETLAVVHLREDQNEKIDS
jgi:hypothetical protein